MNNLKKIFIVFALFIVSISATFAQQRYYVNIYNTYNDNVKKYEDNITIFIQDTGKIRYLYRISTKDKDGNTYRYVNYDFTRPQEYWKLVDGEIKFVGRNDTKCTDINSGACLAYYYDNNHKKYFIGFVNPYTDVFSGMWLDTEDDVIDAFATWSYVIYYALRYNEVPELMHISIDGAESVDTQEYVYDLIKECPDAVFVRDKKLHYSDNKWYSLEGATAESPVILSDGRTAYLLTGWLMLDGRAVSDMVDPQKRFRLMYYVNVDVWQELKKCGSYQYVLKDTPTERELYYFNRKDNMGHFIRAKGMGSYIGSHNALPDPDWETVEVCKIPVKHSALEKID